MTLPRSWTSGGCALLALTLVVGPSRSATADPGDPPSEPHRSGVLDDAWEELQLQVPTSEDKPLAREAGSSETIVPRGKSGGVSSPSWIRSTLALAGVLALIVLMAWGYRSMAGGRLALAGRTRRPGLIEVVSRTSLSSRQSLCLVRVGPRMVLVGIAGDRLSALDVIDDADLTARLAGEQRARTSGGAGFSKALRREQAGYEREAGLDEAAIAPDATKLSDLRDHLTKTIQRIRKASSTASGVLEQAEAPAGGSA